MIDDQELTRRVADSLRAYAETVTLQPQGFDPTHRMTDVVNLDADVVPTGATRSPGRRAVRSQARLVAAVAALALAVAGVTAWVAQRDGGEGEGGESAELVTMAAPPAPSDGLAPTRAPGGWEVARVEWSTTRGSTPLTDLRYAHGDRAQLFGDPANPAVALLVESAGGIAPQDQGEPLTVRGQPGYVVHPGEADLEGRDDVAVVTWTEAGTELRASFRGLGVDDALAALDGLQVRAGGPAAGFEAPADAGLTQLDEAEPSSPPATYVSLTYEATTQPDQAPRLWVDAVAPTGTTTVRYLYAWFYGERADDGTATVWDPSSSMRTIVRPDGQAVWAQLYTLDEMGTRVAADGIEGVGPAEQVTAEAAASVAPVTADQLAGWWAAVNGQRVSLPLMARVELPTATIQVRGDDSEKVLCRESSAETVCYPALDNSDRTLVAGLPIDGVDYEVAASPHEAPQFITYGSEGPYAVEAETGSDDGWHVGLARFTGLTGGISVNGNVSGDLDDCLTRLERFGEQERADEIRRGDGGLPALLECQEAFREAIESMG